MRYKIIKFSLEFLYKVLNLLMYGGSAWFAYFLTFDKYYPIGFSEVIVGLLIISTVANYIKIDLEGYDE